MLKKLLAKIGNAAGAILTKVLLKTGAYKE